jgi:hypothetical protein
VIVDGPTAGTLEDIDDGKARAQSLRRTAYLTAGMGLAHALLFLLSFWLLFNLPGVRDSATGITDIYQRRLKLAGLYLMPFAGIAFIWFIVALRLWTSGYVQRGNDLHSNIQLISGILYVSLFFAAGAASATAAASVEFEGAALDPSIAQQFPRYASTIIFVFAVRMAAMFVFTTSNIGRSTAMLPRWFRSVGFIVGLFLLLSASFSRLLVLVFPIWVLVLCALILVRARQLPVGMVPLSPGTHAMAIDRGGRGGD